VGAVHKAEPQKLTASLLMSNVFDYKYIHSRRVPEFFGYHAPHWPFAGDQSPDNPYLHNADSVVLNLAEAAAFGGGAACDGSSWQGNRTLYSDEEKRRLRVAENGFWRFVGENRSLYEGYFPLADVGIVFHDLPEGEQRITKFRALMSLAKELAGRGVLWDVLTDGIPEKAIPGRQRILIYQDVARISEEEVEVVYRFMQEGGLVIASGSVGDFDEWFRMRVPKPDKPWPPVSSPPELGVRRPGQPLQQSIGSGALVYRPNALTADEVIIIMPPRPTRAFRSR
jgi:hypothetical protein